MAHVQRSNRIILVLIVVLSLTGVATSAREAAANESPASALSFLLEPVGQPGPYIALTLDPGSTTSATVALGNTGSETVSVRTFF